MTDPFSYRRRAPSGLWVPQPYHDSDEPYAWSPTYHLYMPCPRMGFFSQSSWDAHRDWQTRGDVTEAWERRRIDSELLPLRDQGWRHTPTTLYMSRTMKERFERDTARRVQPKETPYPIPMPDLTESDKAFFVRYQKLYQALERAVNRGDGW